jgi:TolA-binding protein
MASVLMALAAGLGIAPAAGAAVSPAPINAPAHRSQLVLQVDREAEFEVAREADGAAVVIRIDRPTASITVPPVAADDALVGSVSLEDDPETAGSRVRVHLRDRSVRTAAQTLVNPFRIVLDLVSAPPPEAAPARTAAERSLFALAVPMPEDPGPPLLTPVWTAPAEGPGAARFKAAAAAFDAREEQEARDGFAAFLKEYPDSPLVETAAYYLAELEFRRALRGTEVERLTAGKAFDALGQRFPRSPNVALGLVRMGEVLLREGKTDEVAPLTDIVAEEYADTPFVRAAAFLRGRIALGANHLRTAIAQFQRVRRGGVDDDLGAWAAFLIGDTLGRMGRYPEAVRFYERGLRHLPGAPKADPHRLQRMGRALMEAGRFRDARYVFLALYNLYPDRYPSGLALSMVADTFRGEGRWERAEEGYQDVILHHPQGEGSLAARISLADLYVDRHRSIAEPVIAGRLVGSRIGSSNADDLVAEALRLYGEVVELAPSDTLAEEATYKLALLFEELGDGEEALARLLDLVTRNPATDWRRPARELAEAAFARRATDLMRQGKPAPVVALYRTYRDTLFEGQIAGWTPLYPLGLAHEALGLNREAMRAYLALLGSNAPRAYRLRAVYRLGNLYMERDEPEEALKRYTYFLRRNPGGAVGGELRLRLAEAHAALGHDGEAAAQYGRYLAEHPHGEAARRVRLALADLQRRRGDLDKARALYEAVLAADRRAPRDDAADARPDPPTAIVHLRLAEVEQAAGSFAAAVAAYQAAVDAGLTGEDRRWAVLRAASARLAAGGGEPAREHLVALADEGGASIISAVAREMAASAALR